jgi:hypothetical protein
MQIAVTPTARPMAIENIIDPKKIHRKMIRSFPPRKHESSQ